MLAVGRCAVYVLLWLVPGSLCSTLRLHRDHRFMLPQDRGFSSVSAFDQVLERSAEQHRHRARRSSSTDTAVPKVYGRVRQVCLLILGKNDGFKRSASIINLQSVCSPEIFQHFQPEFTFLQHSRGLLGPVCVSVCVSHNLFILRI